MNDIVAQIDKDIEHVLENSKQFDVTANYDYVSEMLDAQLDYFSDKGEIDAQNLTDDSFERWVKELCLLCATCYAAGWERSERNLNNSIFVQEIESVINKFEKLNNSMHYDFYYGYLSGVIDVFKKLGYPVDEEMVSQYIFKLRQIRENLRKENK